MERLLETFGEGPVLFAAALLIGMVFGAAAQHSRFCLRAATVEFAHNRWGSRIGIWFVAFCTAVLSVQSAIAFGLLDVSDARPLASIGSISGALLSAGCCSAAV